MRKSRKRVSRKRVSRKLKYLIANNYPHGEYVGEFFNGERNGLGTFTWATNGDKYIGEFRDGLFYGYGIRIQLFPFQGGRSVRVIHALREHNGLPGAFIRMKNNGQLVMKYLGGASSSVVSIKNIKDALVSFGAPFNIIDFILNEYADNVSDDSTHSSHSDPLEITSFIFNKFKEATQKRSSFFRHMSNLAQPRLRSVLKSHYEDILGYPWDSKILGPLPIFTGLSCEEIKNRRRIWELWNRPPKEFNSFQKALERTKNI